MDVQRSSAIVERGDDAQSVSALGRGKASLFLSRIEINLGWAQPNLKKVYPVGSGRIRLAVVNPTSSGHALELTSLQDARNT
jgi:hypothetical protein